jgi:type I restriction enzyme, R subunit
MSPPHPDAEDALEAATVELFAELGWATANAYSETFPGSFLGRETAGEVVLRGRLRGALERLNPALPPEAIDQAVEELARDRSALSTAQANREVYRLLRGGVTVRFRDDDDNDVEETARVVDWRGPANNDLLLVQQFWVTGELHRRRPDLVGFVNGLPLVLVELKAHTRQLENAYHDNLRDYKDTIPQIFWNNALILLSNGVESRVGSLSSKWEHFAEWKKISDEDEPGVISLETTIRGTCEPRRLLDLVENFTLFSDTGGALIKLLAKNHQFLGVNNAVDAVHNLGENQGRLGVFWHTQGSGKSYSMIFFAQKVLRKLPGNWTFVVVTDRTELDKQIYKNFASVGAVTEPEESVRAESGGHLRQLLRENHRYVFTLVHKFNTDEFVSDRSDIIVITDEAHRSQYDVLAANMRAALPNAAFIGFTGTPLMAGEEKTREVFGDYVSVYDFRQSVEDQATVPLYYENRIPELQLLNETEFSEEMERILEAAELDEEQERKLEHELAREYHLITRDERLETIAADLVQHFLGRGFPGKAMVVSIDKATAVRMYDKVQAHWQWRLDQLRRDRAQAPAELQDEIGRQIAFMDETDMAVVVSQSQNEFDDFKQKGLNILPHRTRMVKEDLETKFKDPANPFRIVFVCSMWMTGFDAPSVSTVYLDKPMKNHTLMQTIARANRVWGEKQSGMIVDYVGVFRNLQKALAIYGGGAGGERGGGGGEGPIRGKEELVRELEEQLQGTVAFCSELGIDVPSLVSAEGFQRIAKMKDAREAVLVNEDTKKRYLALVSQLKRLYKAVLPDPAATRFAAVVSTFGALADMVRAASAPVSVAEVMGEVERLLDRSITAEPFVIRPKKSPYGVADRIDLSQIDFELLREKFAGNHKRTQVERLKAAIGQKLEAMVALNRTRTDYLETFLEMIEEYNAGSKNVEIFFDELLAFTKKLSAEEQRALAENLSEEELAVFDLLMRPHPELSDAEVKEVKTVARELLETLKREKLVLDWRRRQQSRAAVLIAVQDVLDKLPRAFTTEMYNEKCQRVYQHVFDAYADARTSVYGTAA